MLAQLAWAFSSLASAQALRATSWGAADGARSRLASTADSATFSPAARGRPHALQLAPEGDQVQIGFHDLRLAPGLVQLPGCFHLVPFLGPAAARRGQIVVTERLRPFLNHPVVTLRQTDEGTVMIGDSKEESVDPSGLTI
eukprot:gene39623-48963_t